jgi:type 1 glutamine amidotransferase
MAVVALTTLGADKKIVFIAGSPSHGPGEHEHRAGCLLLKSCLDNLPGVTTVLCSNGWPGAPNALAGAATIVVYSDGAGGHPLLQPNRLKTIGALMDQGVGLVCLHFAVEPTLETGEKEFLNWIGGAFEINWSVNPTWTADFKSLPDHPITRGVKPFKLRDEWYFHMRFREGMKDVTPILSAVPDQSTTNRNDGPHEGNPVVRELVARGEPQSVAWAVVRADGGRGFGLTGGHYHRNWGDDNLRKLVLNAILWTAKIEVPRDGVASMISPGQLTENLDPKPRGR